MKPRASKRCDPYARLAAIIKRLWPHCHIYSLGVRGCALWDEGGPCNYLGFHFGGWHPVAWIQSYPADLEWRTKLLIFPSCWRLVCFWLRETLGRFLTVVQAGNIDNTFGDCYCIARFIDFDAPYGHAHSWTILIPWLC